MGLLWIRYTDLESILFRKSFPNAFSHRPELTLPIPYDDHVFELVSPEVLALVRGRIPKLNSGKVHLHDPPEPASTVAEGLLQAVTRSELRPFLVGHSGRLHRSIQRR